MRPKTAATADPVYVGTSLEQVVGALVHRPNEKLNANELAKLTGLSPATVTRVVDLAIAGGMVPLKSSVSGRARLIELTAVPGGLVHQVVSRDVLRRQGYATEDFVEVDRADGTGVEVFISDPYRVPDMAGSVAGLNVLGILEAAAYIPADLRHSEMRTVHELDGESYPERAGLTPSVSMGRALGARALEMIDQLAVIDRAVSAAGELGSGSARATNLATWMHALCLHAPRPGQVLLWAAAHAERRGSAHLGVLAVERARCELMRVQAALTEAVDYLERCNGIGAQVTAVQHKIAVREDHVSAAKTDELRGYLLGRQESDVRRLNELVAKGSELSAEIGADDGRVSTAVDIGGGTELLLRALLVQVLELCGALLDEFPAAPRSKSAIRGKARSREI